MFGWLRKPQKEQVPETWDCSSCKYYLEYRTLDRLNSDKTITKGEVKRKHCEYGRFDLNDLTPCEKYKKYQNGDGRQWTLYIPAPPTSRPPDKKQIGFGGLNNVTTTP